MTIWERSPQGEAGLRLEQAWYSPGKDIWGRGQAGRWSEGGECSGTIVKDQGRTCVSGPLGVCVGGGSVGTAPHLLQGAALSPDLGSSRGLASHKHCVTKTTEGTFLGETLPLVAHSVPLSPPARAHAHCPFCSV